MELDMWGKERHFLKLKFCFFVRHRDWTLNFNSPIFSSLLDISKILNKWFGLLLLSDLTCKIRRYNLSWYFEIQVIKYNWLKQLKLIFLLYHTVQGWFCISTIQKLSWSLQLSWLPSHDLKMAKVFPKTIFSHENIQSENKMWSTSLMQFCLFTKRKILPRSTQQMSIQVPELGHISTSKWTFYQSVVKGHDAVTEFCYPLGMTEFISNV